MLTAVIKTKDGKSGLITLQSDNKKAMRGVFIIMTENKFPIEVTEEAKPRTVKFKNI